MGSSNPYSNLEKRLERLPSPEEEEKDYKIVTHQTWQLQEELSKRRLGPRGLALLRWLETGQGQTPELVDLLRKVCRKIPLNVWTPENGYLNEQGHLDPEVILEELPGLIHEEHISQALNRFGFGCKPEQGDDVLLAHLLEPDEMNELMRRYTCDPPYNKPIDRLPFETVPGEVEEDI